MEIQDEFQCVIPQIYIGSLASVRNTRALQDHNITHLLKITKQEIKQKWPSCVRTIHEIDLTDCDSEMLLDYFHLMNEWMDEALKRTTDHNVLLFCSRGISRSPTFVAAYLIQHHKMSDIQAIEVLQKVRPCVNPNETFRKALQTFYHSHVPLPLLETHPLLESKRFDPEMQPLEKEDVLVEAKCCESDNTIGLKISPSRVVSLGCFLSSLRGGLYNKARIDEMREMGILDDTKDAKTKTKLYYKFLSGKMIQAMEQEWKRPVSEGAKTFIEQEVEKEMSKE